MKFSCVILNGVKNLKSVRVCIQILRVAQYDKIKNLWLLPKLLPPDWSNPQILVRTIVRGVY